MFYKKLYKVLYKLYHKNIVEVYLLIELHVFYHGKKLANSATQENHRFSPRKYTGGALLIDVFFR